MFSYENAHPTFRLNQRHGQIALLCHINITRYHARRAGGALVYWDLQCVLQNLRLQHGSASDRQKASYWKELFRKSGLDDDHILTPHVHVVADGPSEGCYAFRAALSTIGVLLAILRLATSVHSQDDRERASGFLVGFLQGNLHDCVFGLGDLEGGLELGVAYTAHMMSLGDGVLSAVASLQDQVVGCGPWPKQGQSLAYLLVDVFTKANTKSKQHRDEINQVLLMHLLNSVSTEIDAQLQARQWPTRNLRDSGPIAAGCPADPALHEELRQLGSQPYITARIAADLGFGVHQHSANHENLRCWKYYMAMRREHQSVRTLAIFWDGKRISGRERNVLLTLNGDTGRAGVAPPMVTKECRL